MSFFQPQGIVDIPLSPAEKVATELKIIKNELCEYIEDNSKHWDNIDNKFFKTMLNNISNMIDECKKNELTPRIKRYNTVIVHILGKQI